METWEPEVRPNAEGQVAYPTGQAVGWSNEPGSSIDTVPGGATGTPRIAGPSGKRRSKVAAVLVAVLLLAAIAAAALAAYLFLTRFTSEQAPVVPAEPEAGRLAVTSEPEMPSPPPGEAQAPVNDDGATPNVDALNEIIGEDETAKLMAQAETDADAYWIASHVEAFEFEGETVQWKMLKLAADEPTSLKYVRDFADKYPQETADMDPALAMDESYLKGTKYDTGVPHLYQWDRRWGNVIYSSTSFGLTGCGPACMAMVYQGLTGNSDLSPYDMAVRAQEGGFMEEFEGTDTSFYFRQAEELGLGCASIGVSADSIRASLGSGHLVVANLGEGYFTRFGHFFVLVGIDENGDIIINDPYSEVRSTQTWDAELIANESKALIEFSR